MIKIMSEELSPYNEINSIERNLSCDEKVMLSVYDFAKTLGVSPGKGLFSAWSGAKA